jgi:hypothetical protein
MKAHFGLVDETNSHQASLTAARDSPVLILAKFRFRVRMLVIFSGERTFTQQRELLLRERAFALEEVETASTHTRERWQLALAEVERHLQDLMRGEIRRAQSLPRGQSKKEQRMTDIARERNAVGV